MKKLNTYSMAGIIFCSSFTLANVAQAQGLYLLGNIGSSSLEHSIERSLGAGAPALPAPDAGGISSVTESDFSFGAGLGYRFDVSDQIFLGLEGFYDEQNNSSKNINGVLVTELDLESSYGLRFLAGVNVNDKFSVYAHTGVTELDFDVHNSYTFAPPTRDRSDTESGFTFGLGADYKLNDHYGVYAQYSKTADIDFSGIPEVAGGTGRVNPNEIDLTQFTIGLKYSF